MPASPKSKAARPARSRLRAPRNPRAGSGGTDALAYGSLGRTKSLILAALRVWELKNGVQSPTWGRYEPIDPEKSGPPDEQGGKVEG